MKVDMGDRVEHTSLEIGNREDRAALVSTLRSHAVEIRRHGVTSLTIFGSRTRGDERADSDLDVLIAYDTEQPFTLYDLVRVQRLLEGITGLDVHVSTRDGFPEHQLARVLKDAVSVL
jgi:predicted nucleotidyltransferase